MITELLIMRESTAMIPPVVESVKVDWDRAGQPGKMTFEVVKTDGLDFREGDPVRFSVDGEPFFFGFVFDKARSGRDDRIIKVTAYDQLYYLKNRDSYYYEKKTASSLIKMIGEDFGLNMGDIADTGYVIKERSESDKTLFDIIGYALDETLSAKKQMYVLYDKTGRLTLTNVSDMKLDLVICAETAGDYDYKSSIAEGAYNKIKLAVGEEGSRKLYVSQDSEHIAEWGVLQYYKQLDSVSSILPSALADALLSLYNQKKRTLTIKDALGDVRVRPGSLLPVILGLGDINVSSYLMVEQVSHTFGDNLHLMDMKMRGGKFVA